MGGGEGREGRAEEVCDAFPSFRPSRETADLPFFLLFFLKKNDSVFSFQFSDLIVSASCFHF